MEIRALGGPVDVKELRLVRSEGGGVRLGGYAALFNSESVDLGGFVERIAPGAFAESVANNDIRALFNHESGMVLGRRSAGTLRLSEDLRGLPFEIDLPDTTVGRDVAVSIERRDITGMSFQFGVRKDNWAKIGGAWLRTLLDVNLMEISPVTFPAYPATEVGLRSADADGSAQAFLRAKAEHEARARRLRLLELSVR